MLTLNFLFFNHLMKINFALTYYPSFALTVMSVISLPSVNILISSKKVSAHFNGVSKEKKHTYNEIRTKAYFSKINRAQAYPSYLSLS